MATLTGQRVQDSYRSLVKTETNSGFNSSSPTRIEDGAGNKSALYLGSNTAGIVGSLSLNISSVSTPRADLHIVGTAAQSVLVQNASGYNKFYIGDYLGAYNVKFGDIDATSSGNNTHMYIEDQAGRITSKVTHFGINQSVPKATFHVGNYSGTSLFELGTSTDAFKITRSGNTSLFTVDTVNDKVIINGSIEMRGKGSFKRPSERIELEEYFAQLPRPYLRATETKDWGSIADGDEEAEDITVTGAELGDFARASFSLDVQDLELSAQVTAANTVTVTLSNNTGGGIDLGSGTITVHVDERMQLQYKNPNIMITGTNADGVGQDVMWHATEGGIGIQTDGADNDQVILFPRGGADDDPLNSSMWGTGTWRTDAQVHWEGAIKTDSDITNIGIFAGLKLTATGLYTTDADQAYFLFADHTDDDLGTLTTNGNLHFVYSVGGTDIVTDLGITVAASTIYRLRIEIDSSRQVSVFVNDVQYGLATSAVAGGSTQTENTQRSNALTTNIYLNATVGVQSLAAAAKKIYVFYERISRVIGS